MTNWDGINISTLYQRVVKDYEKIIGEYSFKKRVLNEHETIYIVQDTFVLFLGLINYGSECFSNYKIVFEELMDNDIYKFNFSKFARNYPTSERIHIVYKRFHGVWGEPIMDTRSVKSGIISDRNSCGMVVASRADYINNKIPELKLWDRYNQWEGYLYNFIIYELNDSAKTGYAIYCSDNPQVHKTARDKANEVEWCALEYYSIKSRMDKNIIGTAQDFSRYQFEKDYLVQGVNCDEAMIDILIDKIERHKANGWEHKRKKKLKSEK